MILSVVLLASTLSQRFYLTVGPSVPIDYRYLLAVLGSDNIAPDSVVIKVGLTCFDGGRANESLIGIIPYPVSVQ
ncbi:hypothetical protein V2W45_1392169 [Cenococcum geophilum]